MEQKKLPKWEAKVTKTLHETSPDQIWPLFEDFFGINKYFPGLATSRGIHGTNGQPGCIRYCAGSGIKSQNGDVTEASWSEERLVHLDREKMSLSYEIVDSNVGFKSYLSTIEVVEVDDGRGCSVEWGISLEPVEGWELEELVKKYQVGLEGMLNKMVATIATIISQSI